MVSPLKMCCFTKLLKCPNGITLMQLQEQKTALDSAAA